MNLKKARNQELADEAKVAVVRTFHIAEELHKRACASQCKASVKASGKLLRNVSRVKDDGLDLDGCLDDGSGGITVQSGGT